MVEHNLPPPDSYRVNGSENYLVICLTIDYAPVIDFFFQIIQRFYPTELTGSDKSLKFEKARMIWNFFIAVLVSINLMSRYLIARLNILPGYDWISSSHNWMKKKSTISTILPINNKKIQIVKLWEFEKNQPHCGPAHSMYAPLPTTICVYLQGEWTRRRS